MNEYDKEVPSALPAQSNPDRQSVTRGAFLLPLQRSSQRHMFRIPFDDDDCSKHEGGVL